MAFTDSGFMLRLREALEASWDGSTSYGAVEQAGNRALGQCYPTCRVVQHYYPETEIVKGKILTSDGDEEIHFWNAFCYQGTWHHIDLSWQQFSHGAKVIEFVVLDRHSLGDSGATTERCNLLLTRVADYLCKCGFSADGRGWLSVRS